MASAGGMLICGDTTLLSSLSPSSSQGTCSHTHTKESVTKTVLCLPEQEKELKALKVEHEGLPVA